jgi:beta-N-acetylhexosaminidase
VLPSEPTDPDVLAGGRVLCTIEGTSVDDSMLDRLRRGGAAGVLLFKANIANQDQMLANAQAIEHAALSAPFGAPAIIAVDQEGGNVVRVPGPPTQSAESMGLLSAAEIRSIAAATATNLVAWGVNVDLAPVADVARTGSFEDRQHRAFSADSSAVAADVAAFVAGLHDGGAAATLKHYPGLGSALTNTDAAAVSLTLSSEELRDVDERPFIDGIGAGAELVMMSSATYIAVDGIPAVFSSVVVNRLREGLGFDGVIVSDAMGTPALAAAGSLSERTVRAARAGVDLFIAADPTGCVEMQSALADAIRNGQIPLADAALAWSRLQHLRLGLASAQ